MRWGVTNNHVAIIVFQAFVVKEILRGGGGAQF